MSRCYSDGLSENYSEKKLSCTEWHIVNGGKLWYVPAANNEPEICNAPVATCDGVNILTWNILELCNVLWIVVAALVVVAHNTG